MEKLLRGKKKILALVLAAMLVAGTIPFLTATAQETDLIVEMNDFVAQAQNLPEGTAIANKVVNKTSTPGLFDVELYVAGKNGSPKAYGIDVVYVIDTSSSMSDQNIIDARNAVANSIDALFQSSVGSLCRVAVVTFNEWTKTANFAYNSGTRNWTTKNQWAADKTKLTSTNSNQVVSGAFWGTASRTNTQAGIHAAHYLLNSLAKTGDQAKNGSVIVLLTDGGPNKYYNTTTNQTTETYQGYTSTGRRVIKKDVAPFETGTWAPTSNASASGDSTSRDYAIAQARYAAASNIDIYAIGFRNDNNNYNDANSIAAQTLNGIGTVNGLSRFYTTTGAATTEIMRNITTDAIVRLNNIKVEDLIGDGFSLAGNITQEMTATGNWDSNSESATPWTPIAKGTESKTWAIDSSNKLTWTLGTVDNDILYRLTFQVQINASAETGNWYYTNTSNGNLFKDAIGKQGRGFQIGDNNKLTYTFDGAGRTQHIYACEKYRIDPELKVPLSKEVVASANDETLPESWSFTFTLYNESNAAVASLTLTNANPDGYFVFTSGAIADFYNAIAGQELTLVESTNGTYNGSWSSSIGGGVKYVKINRNGTLDYLKTDDIPNVPDQTVVNTFTQYAAPVTIALKKGFEGTLDFKVEDADIVLICDNPEHGHVHGDECYLTSEEPLCDIEDPEHEHTAECYIDYSAGPVCGYEEGVQHEESCYVKGYTFIFTLYEVTAAEDSEILTPAGYPLSITKTIDEIRAMIEAGTPFEVGSFTIPVPESGDFSGKSYRIVESSGNAYINWILDSIDIEAVFRLGGYNGSVTATNSRSSIPALTIRKYVRDTRTDSRAYYNGAFEFGLFNADGAMVDGPYTVNVVNGAGTRRVILEQYANASPETLYLKEIAPGTESPLYDSEIVRYSSRSYEIVIDNGVLQREDYSFSFRNLYQETITPDFVIVKSTNRTEDGYYTGTFEFEYIINDGAPISKLVAAGTDATITLDPNFSGSVTVYEVPDKVIGGSVNGSWTHYDPRVYTFYYNNGVLTGQSIMNEESSEDVEEYNNTASFYNEFTVTPPPREEDHTPSFEILKTTNGYNGVFTFNYSDGANVNGTVRINTADSNSSGRIYLPVNYTGTVTVSEVNDRQEGWTYDSTVYTLTYSRGLPGNDTAESVSFSNTYKGPDRIIITIVEQPPVIEEEVEVVVEVPEVPLASFEPEKEIEEDTIILQPDVPLASLPQTGVLSIYSTLFIIGAIVAALGLTVKMLTRKPRKDDNK